MDFFLSLLSSGLVIGATYSMIAMAYAIVYKATKLVNFAMGELMMLTAYVSLSLSTTLHLSFFTLFLVIVPVSCIIGLLLERIFIRPMLGQPIFSIVMVTLGLAVLLRSIVVMIYGPDEQLFNPGFSTKVIPFGPVAFYEANLWTLGILAVLIILAWAFFRFSKQGIAMRATADNETASLLMGVNISHIYAISWCISSVIAALAGIMIASMYSMSADLWFHGLKAFPALILGGLDSVIGAGVGGLVVGIIENFSEGYIGQGLKEISGFVVIIIVLMIRPYGLFGERDIERV